MAERRKPTTAVPVDGQRIRALRIERGIEVAAFASLLGVSRPYVAKIELGHSKRVSVTTFGRICEVLRLSPAQRQQIRATFEVAA